MSPLPPQINSCGSFDLVGDVGSADTRGHFDKINFAVVVRTQEGSIAASRVILAADAFSGILVPELAPFIGHVESFVTATAPLPPELAEAVLPSDAAVADTLAAMQRGVPVIVQGALTHQGWNGRADILRRIEVPSTLGAWSYEPIDTKLARETKAGTILQLCLYADLLAAMQGLPPEYMYVVAPWSDF